MPATLEGPTPNDDSEVADIVRDECALVLGTEHEEGFVVLGLPTAFNDRDHVVTSLPQLRGDRRRVVVIERDFHASARC